MATPRQAPVPSEFEVLADLYLALWEQLDQLTGEGKWLDPRPPEPLKLAEEVQRGMEEIQRRLKDPDKIRTVRGDFERAKALLRHAAQGARLAPSEDAELSTFMAYLRDQALHFSRAGDKE